MRTSAPSSHTQNSVSALVTLGESRRPEAAAALRGPECASRGRPRGPREWAGDRVAGPEVPRAGGPALRPCCARRGERAAAPGGGAPARRAAASRSTSRTSRTGLRVWGAATPWSRAMLRAGGGGGVGTVAGKAAATRSATLDPCRAERGRMGPGSPAAAAASGGTQPRSSLCPGRNVESAKPLAERAAKGAGESQRKHLRVDVVTHVHPLHAGLLHRQESPPGSRRLGSAMPPP